MTDIITNIGKERYFKNGETSWDEVYRRVADFIMDTPEERDAIYQLMKEDKFKPNSPCLMNAGLDKPFMSACVALGIDDSLDGILHTFSNASKLMKAGSGVGINYSPLRPDGDLIKDTNGTSSGVVSFMSMFDRGVDVIQQGACFTADTLIATSEGVKKISEVTNRDLLSSFNKDTGRFIFHECSGSWKVRNDDIMKITLTSGLEIFSTFDHPFMMNDGITYYKASELRCGDKLKTFTENIDTIEEVVSVEVCGFNCDVYNVEVYDTHNFVVCNEDMTTGVVVSNSRRGAEIATLDVSHPEIEKFIDCKLEDGKFSNMNISVRVTDEFMKAALNDDPFDLTFNGKMYKTIQAKELFDKIVHNAWASAEPGIQFIDTVVKHELDCDNKDELGSNPCVTGDTLILTKDGEFPIASLIYKEVEIWNGFSWSKVTPYYTGNYETYKLTFDNGIEVITNANHEWCLNGDLNERYTTAQIYDAYTKNDKLDGYGLDEFRWGGHNDPCEPRYHYGAMIKSVIKTGLVEPTYCLTEPKLHTFIANGILTGNCGEIVLRTSPNGGGESCNLGSLNIAKYVKDKHIDFDLLYDDIKIAIRFLDNVIDKNVYPVPEVEQLTKQYRRLGLGIMGLHDAMILCEKSYDSQNGRDFAATIMSYIHKIAKLESNRLGETLGCYPAFKLTNDYAMRNHALTTCAPTGSIATISKCSYGIEPIFALSHTRTTWVDGTPKTYTMLANIVDTILPRLAKDGYDIEYIKDEIIKTGSVQHIKGLSDKWKLILKTSMEISPTAHIEMQATIQNNGVDNAISKTINLPNDATEDDVRDAYVTAWKLGIKGTTVYRDGCRKTQVLNKTSTKEIVEEPISNKRPTELYGTTHKKYSGCGKLYVTVNEKDGKPYEVIVQTSGIGGCPANTEAIGRAISAGLRNGVPATEYIRQLNRVICPKCKNGKTVDGKSCADIIGKCLSLGVEYETDTKNSHKNVSIEKTNVMKCPDCGEEIFMMEGCITCPSCGYSKCT